MGIIYIVIGLIVGWLTKIPWYYSKLKYNNREMYKQLDVYVESLILSEVCHHELKELHRDQYKSIKERFNKL